MERFHFERLLSSKAKRRRFLIGAGALSASAMASLWSHKVVAQPSFSAYPFSLGIASGDPLPDSVVLWTRLAPEPLNGGGMPDVNVPVQWQVALDENMKKVVRQGMAIAYYNFSNSVNLTTR